MGCAYLAGLLDGSWSKSNQIQSVSFINIMKSDDPITKLRNNPILNELDWIMLNQFN